MLIYLLLATSFSIMYLIQYIRPSLLDVRHICYILDVDYYAGFNEYIFYSIAFIVIALMYPIVLLNIILNKKSKIVSAQCVIILKDNFNIEYIK